MGVSEKALLVVAYIRSLEGFAITGHAASQYHHMGATIADAILQAGTNYQTVVEPRVRAIRLSHPAANTTSAFLSLIEREGAKRILQWKDDEKPRRLVALTKLLASEGVESEEDLAEWLNDPANTVRLRELRGIGPKTLDYLRILAGIHTAAADRHVFRLLEEAGAAATDYEEARDILNAAADAMGLDRAVLDQSVWQYMSQASRNARTSRSA